jgi:hypothetical protein
LQFFVLERLVFFIGTILDGSYKQRRHALTFSGDEVHIVPIGYGSGQKIYFTIRFETEALKRLCSWSKNALSNMRLGPTDN